MPLSTALSKINTNSVLNLVTNLGSGKSGLETASSMLKLDSNVVLDENRVSFTTGPDGVGSFNLKVNKGKPGIYSFQVES